MENKGTVIICDSDATFLSQLQQDLQKENVTAETVNDATNLVERALRLMPAVIVANPDAKGFNEYDVCKKLMQDHNIRVVLMTDKNSTHRSTIGDCTAQDVIVKPFDISSLTFLISKHQALKQ